MSEGVDIMLLRNMVAEYSIFWYVRLFVKIIEKIRRKYTGISSKNNENNHCRRKSKVFDPMFNKVNINLLQGRLYIFGP